MYYVPAKSCPCVTDRFANLQLIWIQWVFFASPQYRTFAQPKIRLIIKDACSILAQPFDFVRLLARLARNSQLTDNQGKRS